jgi:hypothetical protein
MRAALAYRTKDDPSGKADVNKTLLTIGAFALWFIPSVGQLIKYLGPWGTGISAAAALTGILLLVKQWEVFRSEPWTVLADRLLPLLVVATVLAFAVLYPISNSGIVGLGSDRDEALDVALRELLHGSYPYYALTYLNNTLTPAPGALLLALPFFLIGTSALQNLFWLPAFLYYSRYLLFRDPVASLAFYSIFILACPGALREFVTGGDYLVNAIYVAIAVGLVARAHERSCSRLTRWSIYIFLAVAVSSRAFYGVVIPVLAVFVGQRDGLRAAIEFACFTALFILVINGPFYAYDPPNFAPLALGRRLWVVPNQFHATLLVPLISFFIASLSIFVKLDEHKLFGAIAIALLPVFATAILFQMSAEHWALDSFIITDYFLPVTVYGGISLMGCLARQKVDSTKSSSVI